MAQPVVQASPHFCRITCAEVPACLSRFEQRAETELSSLASLSVRIRCVCKDYTQTTGEA